MRKVIVLLVLAVLLAIPVIAGSTDAGPVTDVGKVTATTKQPVKAATDEPQEPKAVPKDTGEAWDKGKGLIELAKAKKWFAFSAAIIFILMFLFKLGRKKLGFMQQIPKRVLWIILPLLSIAAMLLSKFQGDLSWTAAMAVLFSGPGAAFLNDFIKRGILNKEYSPMRGSS